MEHEITLRTGAEVLVDCLLAQGVSTIFGVPGESYLAVLDALYDVSDRIRMIPNRHEGGAAFMAEAWGKLTRTPGICFVTRGPGATNAAIGVHTAMQNSTPMILFIGQVETGMRGREAFQEVDYRAFFGPLAKWAVEIEQADRVPEIIARAFAVAQSGRPGPVVVALPEDVLSAATDAVAGPKVRIPRPAPPPEAIEEVERLLSEAKAPLILAAGNWSAAGRADLRRFAEANALPVLVGWRFNDLMDNQSPSFVGMAGIGKPGYMKDLIREADLLLALGPRFGEITTDGYELLDVPRPRARLVHVHASDGELNKIHTATLPIHADPEAVLRVLAETRLASPDWVPRTEKARAAYVAELSTPRQPGDLDMGAVTRHLAKVLPEDAILTHGAGNFAIWINKHFAFSGGQRLLAPQSGAMGYGLPAAIAAKVALPEALVVCLAGDGDFQMTCAELGTAMQAKARPIVLIVNNGTYGTIRMHQERIFPGRVSFTDIENPDFVGLARAYGFHAERVSETDAFPAAFARARESATGAVLELMVSPESLTPRQSLTAIRDAALRG